MTTSAKLQELRELARPVAACTCPPKLNHATGCQDTVLIAALARLVVTLTEALEVVDECCGCVTAGPNDAPRKALAAVEALEL